MLTEMVLLLDKSGSMGIIRKDVIGGLNTFIEDQLKLDGEANFSLYLFSSTLKEVISKNIKEIEKFTEDVYVPQGSTALIECFIKTIEKVDEKIKEMEPKPDKVIFAVMTDGEENASHVSYTKTQLADMIKSRTEYGKWDFVFLGANIDTFGEAKQMNISAVNTMSYDSTIDLGTKGFQEYSRGISSLRGN